MSRNIKKTPRAERVVLCVIKPNTGDLTRGYQFALQTKKNLQLMGEIALADKFNGNKHDAAAVEKIAVKTLDFPHVIAAGWKFCQQNQIVPCRAIRLYGEGCEKVVSAYERVCKQASDLAKAATAANAALVEAAVKSGSGVDYRKKVNILAAKAKAAAKAVSDYAPTLKAERDGYRKRAAAAVAVIAGFDELRKE